MQIRHYNEHLLTLWPVHQQDILPTHGRRKKMGENASWILKFDIFLLTFQYKNVCFELVQGNFTTVGHSGKIPFGHLLEESIFAPLPTGKNPFDAHDCRANLESNCTLLIGAASCSHTGVFPCTKSGQSIVGPLSWKALNITASIIVDNKQPCFDVSHWQTSVINT